MILFYGRNKPDPKYWPFSNFYPAGFKTEGKWYPTSEHYFQSMKFADLELRERVRFKTTPMEAAIMGRDRTHPLREDWEEVKDEVMFDAIRHKFSAHPDLNGLLISTGNEEIVEDSPGDFYWGWGRDHSGKNMLGKLLMRLRRIFRENTRFSERIPLVHSEGLYTFPQFIKVHEELHGKNNVTSDWETMEVIVLKEQPFS